MSRCTECQSVECGFHYADDDENEEWAICDECDSENSIVFYDEDHGSDR